MYIGHGTSVQNALSILQAGAIWASPGKCGYSVYGFVAESLEIDAHASVWKLCWIQMETTRRHPNMCCVSRALWLSFLELGPVLCLAQALTLACASELGDAGLR